MKYRQNPTPMLPSLTSDSSSPIKSYYATSVSPSPISEAVVFGLLRLRGGDVGQPQRPHDLPQRRNLHPHSHNIHSSNSPSDDIQQKFHNTRDNILKQLCPDDTNGDEDGNASTSSNITSRFLAGTLAFYTTAFSLQYLQYKLLKISTGTRPGIVPVGCGMVTVALGSWMGHLAGLGVAASPSSSTSASSSTLLTSSFMQGRSSSSQGFDDGIASIRNAIRLIPEVAGSGYRCAREMMRPMMIGLKNTSSNYSLSGKERRERKEAWMHAARICILGLLTYKTIFRSHFISLSPSSYTARGSFARIGIPAPPNFNYATTAQRTQLERIGRWWGCHTCGSRRIFTNTGKNILFGGGGSSPTFTKFHGDHIPPVSVAKQINNHWHRRALGWKVKQRFYPQCRICSNKQGGLLSRAVNAGHRNLHAVGGGEESFFHGRRLRVGHLTGGVVAALSIGSTTTVEHKKSEVTLVKSSRERMLSIQKWLEAVSKLYIGNW